MSNMLNRKYLQGSRKTESAHETIVMRILCLWKLNTNRFMTIYGNTCCSEEVMSTTYDADVFSNAPPSGTVKLYSQIYIYRPI